MALSLLEEYTGVSGAFLTSHYTPDWRGTQDELESIYPRKRIRLVWTMPRADFRKEKGLESFVVGIVAGLVTALLLLFFRLVYQDILEPRFRAMVYKGIDLQGEWIEFFTKDDATHERIITIHQMGHRLTGEMVASVSKEGERRRQAILDLTGLTKDGYVLGQLVSRDRHHLSLNVFLFQVVEAGRKLKGWHLYRDTVTEGLKPFETEWRRQEQNA